MPTAELALAGDVQDVRAARRFVDDVLSSWEAEEYSLAAVQIVSELASNVALHAHTPFTVRLRLAESVLRLEVQDGSPRHPSRRRYGADATTGRGLGVVEALSESWGVADQGSGKCVWVHLGPPDPGEAGIEDWLERAGWSGSSSGGSGGSSTGWSVTARAAA